MPKFIRYAEDPDSAVYGLRHTASINNLRSRLIYHQQLITVKKKVFVADISRHHERWADKSFKEYIKSPFTTGQLYDFTKERSQLHVHVRLMPHIYMWSTDQNYRDRWQVETGYFQPCDL